MVLFGNEFDADERAEVGGSLRGGEGDEAVAFTRLAVLSVKAGKDKFHDWGWAGRNVNKTYDT
jgi:hypothetical protein